MTAPVVSVAAVSPDTARKRHTVQHGPWRMEVCDDPACRNASEQLLAAQHVRLREDGRQLR